MDVAARKRMEALIQLATFVGGSIFAAIAITAWFTPDRQLVSVWFGFAAACALLLAVAMHAHLYVTTSILQPRIELGPPSSPSHFRWDSRFSTPSLRTPNDQSVSGETAPVFSVSNASPVLAADLSIEWAAPPLDVDQLNANYPQFREYVRNVRAGAFDLLRRGGPDGDMVLASPYNAKEKARISIPFLNRPAETHMPIEVWYRAMPLVIAKLTRPGNAEFDIEFGVTVSWNIPDRGTPQKFILVAHVRNTKQERDAGMMDAEISWLFRLELR
jgi:hypothetical protein